MIYKIYKTIQKLEDLSPSNSTNIAFNNLYVYAINKNKDTCPYLLNKHLFRLQTKCWDAECCMEKYYANNLINSGNAENYL